MFYRKQVIAFDTPAMIHWRFAARLAALEVSDESKYRFPKLTEKNVEKAMVWQRKRMDEMTKMIMEAYDTKTIKLMLDTGMRPAGC